MKFLREIDISNINDVVINNLEQEGFTLVWRESSIEVYYQDYVTVYQPSEVI